MWQDSNPRQTNFKFVALTKLSYTVVNQPGVEPSACAATTA